MTKAQLLAAQFTLEYAKKRWPNANRITHPLLMREIERLRLEVWRAEKSNQEGGR